VEDARSQVKTFLQGQGMYHEDISIDETCSIFLDEMDKGLTGQDSSLAMLPTYIETERDLPRNKPVIVLDAGGTNFRVATVCFKDEGQPDIGDFNVFPMPGIKQEVTKGEFFGTMAGYAKDVLGKSDSVGFCFSYPIEMSPTKDGRVLYFSKEIKAEEVVGKMIGAGLNEAIVASSGTGAKQMVLLNDTVATLLAGRGTSGGRQYDSYIGFILGTGTNTAYVEHNSNITKAKDIDTAKSQIVNVESGGFGKAPRGTIDEQFNAASANPGINTFEKMISGAYLGPLAFMTIQRAAEQGLLSPVVREKLVALDEATTKDVGDFLAQPKDANSPLSAILANRQDDQVDRDAEIMAAVIEAIIERAAKLTATNLSSAVLKSGKGADPDRPVCIVAEGTTFYKLSNLKERVEFYLDQYLVAEKKKHYDIVEVENATLIGAAIAGLTN
jgi:hexokinase